MGIVPAAYEFQMDGEPVACEEFGHGHINSTYKITTDTGHEYVLQKINKYVFHNPVQLMANANAVTSFIREREADPRAAIHFIPTRNDDGSFCHRDSDGEFWRMYDYVGGFCVDQPETDEDFYQAGSGASGEAGPTGDRVRLGPEGKGLLFAADAGEW